MSVFSAKGRPHGFLFFVWALISPYSTYANKAEVSSICDSAAVFASRESGVPLDVLLAITLTETGRTEGGRLRPWPWTVNMEGIGKWFDNLQDARAYVDKNYARGAVSFDIGCFQINYKWHGDAFSSVEDMFDPVSNARYAASFLKDLFEEYGDWSKAAGAYHSRTPKYANRYRARFDRIRGNLDPRPASADLVVALSEPTPKEVIAVRANNFPLLKRSEARNGPSLVPLAENSDPFIVVMGLRPLIEAQR